MTREQALALLRLERTDVPGGALTVDNAGEIAFNPAGYAVRILEVTEDQNLVPGGGDSGFSASGYPADLKQEYSSYGKYSASCSSEARRFKLEPGSYVVVLFATGGWRDFFEAEGNKIKYSAAVAPAGCVAPPTIEDPTGKCNGSLSSSNDGSETLELAIPKGATCKPVMSGVDSSALKKCVVEIDGKKQSIPVGTDAEHAIELPADKGSVSPTVSGGDQMDDNVARSLAGFGARARYELEFV